MSVSMERVLLAGVLALLASFSFPVEAGGRQALIDCLGEGEISADDFISLFKSDGPSQNFKCFVRCTLKKSKLMRDGTLESEDIKAEFDTSVGMAIDTCILKSQLESEECERAYAFLSCSMVAKPREMVGFFLATDENDPPHQNS